MALSASAKSKSYNKKTLSKMAARDKSSGSDVQGLASKLEGLTKTAKGLGIDTARSDAMIAQTSAEGSKSYKGSSYDKGQMDTINSESMKPVGQVNIPKKDTVTDLTSFTDSVNASLATGSQGAYTYDATTYFVNTPTETKTPDTATQNFNQMMQAMGLNQANQFNAVDETKALQKALRPKENLVSSYQNQINQITAQRDAQQLGLEGQGRGQTSGFLGGEQARIGREAAIQAMPLQAQLAAAQDDLESARSYASQMYTAKAQDAQAKYQYEANKIQAVYGFLTAQEAKVARAKEVEQSRAWQVEDRNLSMASSLADKAFETGQSSLAGKIMALDTKSPTFASDIARLQGQLVKPVAKGDGAPKVVSVNGVDSVWNPTTGQFEAITVGGVVPTNPQDLQKVETLNDIDTILQLTDTQLQSSLGKRNIIQRNIPGTSEYQFTAQHENLINQLALAARGELKGQGQVSDYEGKLLKSAQTTLNLYMDPKAYRKEAKQVRGAIQTSSGIPASVKVMSKDGQTRYAVLGSQEIQEAVNQGYVIEYQ